MVWRAKGRGCKSGLARLKFSESMCEISIQIYYQRFGERKHRNEACIRLESDSMMYVKFANHPRRAGTTLHSKPSHCERTPVSSCGTYIGSIFQSTLVLVGLRNKFVMKASQVFIYILFRPIFI